MKANLLFLSIIVLLSTSCGKNDDLKEKDPNNDAVEFREKYVGSYEVVRHSMSWTQIPPDYVYKKTDTADTTITIIVSYNKADTISGYINGVVYIPAMLFDFGSGYKQKVGVDSSGKIYIDPKPLTSTTGGFVSTDGISYSFTYKDKYSGEWISVAGKRVK